MGLAVVNNSVNFNADLPIFGNIANKRDLLFAFRPSANALFDLSDYQNTVTVAGQVTDKGVKGYNTTATATSFKDPTTDDVTVIVCGRATDLVAGVNNRTWLASSYNTKSGIGFLITADMVSGTNDVFNIKLRSYMTAQTSSGSFASVYPSDITIATNAKVTATDFLYIVLRINANAKVLDVRILNKALATSRTFTSGDNITASGRNVANGKTWQIGSSHAGSVANAPAEVQQLLVYGRYLTDAEITEQYEMDKKWLKSARNIEL